MLNDVNLYDKCIDAKEKLMSNLSDNEMQNKIQEIIEKKKWKHKKRIFF